MAKSVRWHNADEWSFKSPPPAATARGRRRAGRDADQAIPPQFLSDQVSVVHVKEATPRAGRQAAGLPLIDVSVEATPREGYVLVMRHPSGALTFHAGEPDVQQRRTRRAQPTTTIRFRVPLRTSADVAQRRGLIPKPVKVALLKVSGIVADAVLPTLATAWESRTWKKAGRKEGWIRLDAKSLTSGELTPGVPAGDSTGSCRTLLFLHGTFSHAASAFKGLAGTKFFSDVSPVYGDRIFAFNHFSLSKTPEQNARDLLAQLPSREIVFDVVTHSRGGLVLRNLIERSDALGASSRRFKLGNAVLVAAPNNGTPLATPTRWQETLGWVANLVEMFPDNPLTFAAEWVSEGIVWLAERAAGGIPGLAAMDAASEMVSELQSPPGPPLECYSALAANFTPDDRILLRMLDVGIDSFFGGANDLVVPTEGGWQIDLATGADTVIPAGRIGCFGPGGNLAAAGSVHHLNFFSEPATADFLVRALKGQPHGLPPLDPAIALPVRSRRRGGAGERAAARAVEAPAPAEPAHVTAVPSASPLSAVFSDAFQLTVVLPGGGANTSAQLLASYGGARVIEPFNTKGGADGRRWHQIIAMQERLKGYVDGRPGFSPPENADLIGYGRVLFDTLFPPEVRRLYDVARSRQKAGSHLNVVFTSMIPWVADKPWEFAYDPNRQTYLATEEIHFVRNALTAVPAAQIDPTAGPLRILVAVAQPVGLGKLSADDEEAVIRRGFQALIEANLVEVEVLRQATPASLHRWISFGRFDIVHFIGHGDFDDKTQEGYLVFEDGRGSSQNVNARTAREILCERGIRMVFLNACDTGREGHAMFNRGIAPALVAGGLPAVVANQFKVLDQSATEFAQHFYWALAQGATLGAATRDSRIAVNYSISGENIDWAVPVVYARDPESRLCEARAPSREMIVTPLVAHSARRATRLHKKRVAVWDVNHAFPTLNETVMRMNEAQTTFGFEVVDVSAPIGTWRRVRQSSAQIELDVNFAAKRLRYKTQELGVDYLFCITDLPLRYTSGGKVFHNYYNWWPDTRGEGNLIIFSTSFDNFPGSGPEFNRAVANAVVEGVVGTLAEIGTHARGPKNCPLYWNPQRRLDFLTGRQEFDAKCDAALRKDKNVKADLPDLKALLRAFD